MKKGGIEVWQQANIEWWLFFDRIPQLGYQFHHFEAILKGRKPSPTPAQLQTLKDQTWEKVRESIDRGVPAIAWQPMTLEQKKQGIYGFEWSLLLGYDAEVEALIPLEDLCRQGADAGALTPALAQEAVKYLDKALDAERKAVAQIEMVVGR